ncbi:MAG: carbon-nitrogen hydrolase family protein [Clostridia bacterium]
MKISLVQSVQNRLYDFENNPMLAISDRISLSDIMAHEVIALCDTCGFGEIIVTTEAVNFPGNLKCGKEILKECVKKNLDSYIEAFSHIAKKHRSYVVAGLYRILGEDLYNSAYIFAPNGNIIDIYDKIYLAGDERDALKKGDRYVTFDTPVGKAGIMICYDAQFSETVINLKNMGADFVLCPTWGWEKEYVLKRAKEVNLPMIGAMALPYLPKMAEERNPSGIIYPDGRIIEAKRDEDGIFKIEV